MAQSKKFSVSWTTWLPLLVGLLVAFAIFLFIKKLRKKGQGQAQVDETVAEEPAPPSQDHLIVAYRKIASVIKERYGEENPVRAILLTAQAAHETGDFTSEIFSENINLFGMRNPQIRETTSLGDKNGYAYYSTEEDSIVDRLMWDEYNKVATTATVVDFVKELNRLGYFTDSFLNYKNAIVKWVKIVQGEVSRG